MEDCIAPDSTMVQLSKQSDIHVNGNAHLSGGRPESSPSTHTTDQVAGKRARFNIEKVDLERRLSPPSLDHALNQSTIHEMETIGYATHEAVPLTMFYRNDSSMVPGQKKARPTLAELHKSFDELDEQDGEDAAMTKETESVEDTEVKVVPRLKFGWLKGVLVPCLLNIWGVILYLRLPWLTGQSGILLITCIIILSAVVTTITTLSISAICTNGEIKGGGAYYLISRSLGPEFGGSIGIIFSLANAVGVALYVVGFSETVQRLMDRSSFIMVDKLNDIRIIGMIVLLILLGITLIGLDWVLKTQLFLLLILILSMLDYAVGTFSGSLLTDRDVLRAQGFTSYSIKTFSDNVLPEFRGETFFSTFAIFFPAATGILAGVNISGDLKDPQTAIPKGTLTAVGLTTVVYILLAWIIGATSAKDAMGVAEIIMSSNQTIQNNMTNIVNVTSAVVSNETMANISTAVLSNFTNTPSPVDLLACIPKCKYGLLNDYQLMEHISLLGPLVLAGTFAATLSSALASLVGSPKTFQAVCRDKVFKGLEYFGKGSGPNEEPRRAYVLTFFISTGFILVGQLDIIAPIISNFFLMSYALINYSVFAASLGRSPGWRPSFKYYNMWLSLSGCVVCVGIMFLINWWAALVTIVIVMTLYKYVDYKKPEINWGSSGQAHTYIKALKLTHALNRTDQHVKNFRPQCLVLTGAPSTRPFLAHFISSLTKHVGLMICGQVIIKTDGMVDVSTVANQERWLRSKKIKSFVSVAAAPNLRQGAQSLMQCSGLGKLRPNIIVLGFKHDWQLDEMEKVEEYINIIHDSFDGKFNIAILRASKGTTLDYESDEEEYDEELDMELEGNFQSVTDIEQTITGAYQSETDIRTYQSEAEFHTIVDGEHDNTDDRPKGLQHGSNTMTPISGRNKNKKRKKEAISEQRSGAILTMELSVKGGHIDVWWLFDDGGLTMFLPYLLSRKKQWKGCTLRVLTPASEQKLKSNQVRMASLLKKFRIAFSGIVEVHGVNSKPSKESIERFHNSRIKEEIAEDELLDKKSLRQIRLGELVKEYSHDAKLVVLTMPVPRKSMVSNLLYMSWLEVISAGADVPVLFVRGNQTSVLTFYS